MAVLAGDTPRLVASGLSLASPPSQALLLLPPRKPGTTPPPAICLDACGAPYRLIFSVGYHQRHPLSCSVPGKNDPGAPGPLAYS